jgi:hypothetical protein
MNITDTITFDETKLIQEQSTEFQEWFFNNCKITSETPVDSYDEYGRPLTYVFTVTPFTVTVLINYINLEASNWANSGYTISIK